MFKGFLKVLKVYFHGSIKHLQDYQEVYLKKTTNDFILICYVGNSKFNLSTT